MNFRTADDEPAAGDQPARRLVAVHAHPDDETLATGTTLAHYAATGVQVTLVTCTLGDEGEVIGPDLQHLCSAADDTLAAHRVHELSRATACLGVVDQRVLGGGRWRDSGMSWLAPGIAGDDDVTAAHPAAFVRADLATAAGILADILREIRPQVVLTYDPHGGYGHPDHVKAHQVTMQAVELAESPGGRPGWRVPAVHWIQVAASWAQQERRAARLAAEQGTLPEGMMPPAAGVPFPPVVVPDAVLDVVIEATEQLPTVIEALRAHATQVVVQPPWYALSNGVAQRLSGREGFRRVRGPRISAADRPAHDLFAGLPSADPF